MDLQFTIHETDEAKHAELQNTVTEELSKAGLSFEIAGDTITAHQVPGTLEDALNAFSRVPNIQIQAL
jgi:hypothetical protein